ncbi:MAG: 50S ribosomal protein L29 [Chitinophagales bacterium]|jgi:large subunit ribosomal protein L29|nr:50S ribosomal protein L29 [Chitinophagaceae bacterium]MBP9882871.1 50S ribosomal protein L29 [Chitinophagales bacterium]
MAKKKLNLKDLTTPEVVDKLKEDGAHYTKMKFNHVVTTLENPMTLRQLRRDIARMKTELTNRSLTEAKAAVK